MKDVEQTTNRGHTRTGPSDAELAAANVARRRAATEAHQQAIAIINEMFNRVDELTVARDRLSSVGPREPGADPIQDAELLLAHARRLGGALDALRSAALAAVEHRSRSELAADVGTKTTALFPRVARPKEPDAAHACKPIRLIPGQPPFTADSVADGQGYR